VKDVNAMQIKRYFMVLSILALLAGGLFVGAARQPATAQAQNLLANPGFDLPYTNGVANGWSAWYEDSGEKCSTKPADWDFVCQPGWGEEMDYNNLGLTQGAPSQHVGAQYITWHAGVYQTVSVPPGSRVRFTVMGYSRAANEQPPAPSYTDWAPRMQVGIDPEGRGQWYTGVVWSAENNIRDSWQALSIEATAGASGKVTVFVSSQFRLVVPLAHMDSWWDNARLEVVTPPATPTSTPAPTRAAPPTPQYTPTPRPDGAVVHVVQEGDTLFGIALQYNVPLDELRRLNAGTLGPNDLLQIGQEIIISGAPLTLPTPTPTPETAAPTAAPTEAAPIQTPAPAVAGLCVSAYYDRNGDGIQQPETEGLLPNAVFTLVSTTGPAGSYTTDGISEPYCFQNLTAGNYVLRQTPPAGYQPVGPGEWGVALSAGQISALQLGYTRATETPGEAQPTAAPSSTEEANGSSSGLSKTLNTILKISGAIVLLLALGVAALFVLSRRGR